MMKLDFPDRLNPVFVKELRQSIRERSLLYSVLVIFAAEILLGYFNSVLNLPPRTDFQLPRVFFLFLLALILIGTLLHLGHRTESERGKEGIDPAAGTGFSPWGIVCGKMMLAWSSVILLLLAASPALVWIVQRFRPVPWGVIGCIFCGLFVLHEVIQCISAYSGLHRRFPGTVLQLFFILSAGGFFLSLLSKNGVWRNYPLLLGTGLLLAGIFASSMQAVQYMPPASNRGCVPKVLLIVQMLYWLGVLQAVYPGSDWHPVVWGGAWFFFWGALCERQTPSRRQCLTAPRDPVLRVCSLLFVSGTFPGMLAGTVLLAVSMAGCGMDRIAAVLAGFFYIQLAHFWSRRCHIHPLVAYLLVMGVCNLPAAGGSIWPWGAVLSGTGAFFVGAENALIAAAAAALITAILNLSEYRKYIELYFKEEK